MKRSALLSASVVLAAFVFSCITWSAALAAAFKPEKNKIAIAISQPVATYLPIYLAVDQGLFEKEGLKVELVTFQGGSELTRAVVAGSIDIGYSGLASSSVGIDANQKMKIFYAGNNSVEFSWYAIPKIKSMANVKGARIGVSRYGSSSDSATRYALKSYGLDPERDAKIIQSGAPAMRMAALEKGQLDVSIFAVPDDVTAAEKGFKLILSQKDLAEEYPIQTFYATEKFIKENPNTIKAALRAYVEAVRLAKKNKELAINSLAEHCGFDKKGARIAYEDLIDHLYEDGRWPDKKSMDVYWQMGIIAGVYKEPWPLQKYFDSTFTDTFSQWKP